MVQFANKNKMIYLSFIQNKADLLEKKFKLKNNIAFN